MKRITTFLFLLVAFSSAMMGSVTVDGTTYPVDTISQRQEGPGIVCTRLRLPSYPLNVYVLEMNLNNAYNRVETTYGYNVLGKTEGLVNAYNRHKAEGKKPIAACNGNFWVVGGTGEPWISYMMGFPMGGVVCNDTIVTSTNSAVDTWDGGPYSTGSAAIDHDKVLYMGRKFWTGTAASGKWASALEITQVNKRCNDGELALFGPPFGRTRALNTLATNHNIFLKFKEGSSWAVGKNMEFTVAAIVLDKAGVTLGDYDACLTGSGDFRDKLAALAVGDEITINQSWATIDKSPNVSPNIENLVEGNAYIMLNGQLTDRNENEGYNSMVYSRTMYGCSQDGKTLYMVVADKSTNEYGTSAGCPTAFLCKVMQQICPGIYDMVNFDAGGSAQMMVKGAVINKTTEGTPRAVEDGWMLFSTAPDDNVIASIAFDNPHLKMPILTSYAPKVLGYNQYGDLIDEDVKGVTFSCSPAAGTSDGKQVNAGSTPGYGTVTATLGSLTVTSPIEIIESKLSIKVKPTILIDAKRQYPIAVTSTVNHETFSCNPAIMSWTLGNDAIAGVTGGILQGKSEGTTPMIGSYKTFSDTVDVKVEIAGAPILRQPWTDWELKGVGFKNLALSDAGVLSYSYASARGAYASLTKDITFYSLPDKIIFDFTPSMPLQYIAADLRSNTMTAQNLLYYGKDSGGFEAGKNYKIELKITDLGDTTDLALYPIHLKSLRFTPPTSGITAGNYNITINGLYAQYSSFTGIDNATMRSNNVNVYPNPVTDGILNISAAGIDKAQVTVFNQAGMTVMRQAAQIAGGTATIDVSALAHGIYFVKVLTDRQSAVSKIIIKVGSNNYIF